MRICILFLLTISPIVIFCQTKYSSYVSSYFKNKVFDIRINYENENSYTLYIDMQSKENINNGGIIISSGEHQKFIDTLLKVQLKYNEWTKVAKTNNVKEVSKQMELDFTIPLSYFEYGSSKHTHRNSNLVFLYSIDKGNPILTIWTQKLNSIQNRYASHEGFLFVFTSEKEISDFIKKISVKSVKDFIKNPKTSDLFKN